MTGLMAIKSKYLFSNKYYKDHVKLITDVLLEPHKVSKDMYRSKKMLSSLCMKYEKIDACLEPSTWEPSAREPSGAHPPGDATLVYEGVSSKELHLSPKELVMKAFLQMSWFLFFY
jgi:hypothetical protein